MHIAQDEIIGQASIGTGRNPAAFNGKAPDGSDGLKTVLMGNTHPILVGKLRLNLFSRPLEFYGPEELVLLARQIDRKILAQPSRAQTWLQSMAQHQPLLQVGGRTCTVVVAGEDGLTPELEDDSDDEDDGEELNADAFIREKDVGIEQTERNTYDIFINCSHILRGQTLPGQSGVSAELHVPVAQRVEDIQLEVTSSISPLLIERGSLHTTTADGQVVHFQDLD